jgi:hypothetical protein
MNLPTLERLAAGLVLLNIFHRIAVMIAFGRLTGFEVLLKESARLARLSNM